MSAPAGPPANFLEPTFADAARVWWAWFWRSMLIMTAVGALVGYLAAKLAIALDIPQDTGVLLSSVAGGGLGLLGSIYVMKVILKKEFRKFSIRLIPHKPRYG
jgi:hypothetical protein